MWSSFQEQRTCEQFDNSMEVIYVGVSHEIAALHWLLGPLANWHLFRDLCTSNPNLWPASIIS